MEPLNLITVREAATRELTASGARLVVRISGQSFFAGSQAFKKAAEVAACVAAVTKCGLSEDDVRLLNVSTETESGFLTKSSSATYHLQINCDSIELLGAVLAAVSSQKNSRIVAVAWRYPDLDQSKHEVLQEAVRAARSAATAIADSLAVSLLGVHKLSYNIAGLDTETRLPQPAAYASREAMGLKEQRAAEALQSLSLSHTTRLAVTVSAEFIVGTFSSGT